MVWLATGTVPASWVITRTPANIPMSSPIIQLSDIRALPLHRLERRHGVGDGLDAGHGRGAGRERAPHQQHGNGLQDGQVANRDGVEPTARGVHQPRDQQGRDRRDEGVRRSGEHSPRLTNPRRFPASRITITPTPIRTVAGCIDGYAEAMAATPEAIETATVMMWSISRPAAAIRPGTRVELLARDDAGPSALRVGPDRLPVGDPGRQHQEHDRRADGQRVRQAGQASQDQDGQHRLGPVGDRGQRVRRQHGQRHELAHPLHRDRADVQRWAEDQPLQCLAGRAQRRERRLGNARGFDRRQLPVSSRDGHEPGEQGRADLAGLRVLAQRRVDRQRLPPHLRVSGHPAPLTPDLTQGGELTLVKRRNQRVGPRRTRMVLTVTRRTLPASVLPRLSRSRPPAISRAAATRFALAVLRHTQSSADNRPLP